MSYFVDNKGKKSMTRLLLFLTIVNALIIVDYLIFIKDAPMGDIVSFFATVGSFITLLKSLSKYQENSLDKNK